MGGGVFNRTANHFLHVFSICFAVPTAFCIAPGNSRSLSIANQVNKTSELRVLESLADRNRQYVNCIFYLYPT